MAGLRVTLAGLLLLAEACIAAAAYFPRVSDDYRAFYIEHTSHVWPVCHPTKEYAPVSDPIAIGKLDPATQCLLLGEHWWRPEGWAAWTDGGPARLAIPYRPSQRQAQLNIIVSGPPRTRQIVRITVDGVDIGPISVPREGATIDVPLPPSSHPRAASIVLRAERTYRPRDLGENGDERHLGLALASIVRR
jgi:hypothetical protein